MITFQNGNILNANTNIIVNTVNCQGVMGKGIAKDFKKAFPEMFLEYQSICKNNQLNIGTLHIFQETNFTIINFPTKIHWKNPSQYEYISLGLTSLEEYLAENPDKSISIPPLGCGNGNLDKKIVKNMIENALNSLTNKIILYNFDV